MLPMINEEFGEYISEWATYQKHNECNFCLSEIALQNVDYTISKSFRNYLNYIFF